MKLNLGAGRTPLEGYENFDRKTGQEAYPLPLPDESCDEVRASHVLEHFPHSQTVDILRDWVRVLKPGGTLRVAVPDFGWVAKNYLAKKPINTVGYVMGGQTDDDDYHKSIFDEGFLRECMGAVGIHDIRHWESDAKDCAALPVSLNLEGRKRAMTEVKGVAAVMSSPRLGFTENWMGIVKVFGGLHIPFRRSTGAFWAQALECAIEQQIEKINPKYVLTLDYDTVFDEWAVIDLFAKMEADPTIDALAAMEIGRERQSVLLTLENAKPKGDDEWVAVPADVLKDETVKVATAHFGLTMLRADKIKSMPKPWFSHQPNEQGSWGKGRVDDDIYFWRKWRESGNTVHVSTKVVIGHLQQVITWPDRNLRPCFQYQSEYDEKGIPTDCLR